MPLTFPSGRTVTCIAALACALTAFTLAARAQAPHGAANPPAATIAVPARSQPAPGNCPKPEYPPEAKQARWTGASTVAFLIGTDGSVRGTRVLRSSGHAILDDAAMATLKGCTFRPATDHGQLVETWQPVQFVWTLD